MFPFKSYMIKKDPSCLQTNQNYIKIDSKKDPYQDMNSDHL